MGLNEVNDPWLSPSLLASRRRYLAAGGLPAFTAKPFD